MSMVFPLWPFLYLLLTPSTWAGPLSTASLTPDLANIIPTCAQSCLESFIAENFPTSVCGPPPNFPCLCTSDSTSGFTIGEASLECLATGCSVFEESEAVAVYEVCTGVQNAKPNTHSTLTAIQTSVISYTVGAEQPSETNSNNQPSASLSNAYSKSSISTAASSTASGFTTKVTSATRSYSSHSATQHSQTTSSPADGVHANTTPTTTSTSSATRATAAAASSSALPPVLTKPQIAGVTVAGVGAAAIAFGLCFLIFCCRRRRPDRHSISSSFGGDKIVDSEESTPDMSAIARRDFAHHPQAREEYAAALPPIIIPPPAPRRKLRLETPATSSEDGWDQYQRDMDTEYMGPQVPPKSARDFSPITPASNRTRNSQLLPDKPSGNRYSLFPPPSRTPRKSIPGSSLRPPGNSGSSAATRSPSSVNTSQSNLQHGYDLRQPRSDPFLDSSNSPPNIYSHVQASRPRSQHLRPQGQLHPAFRVPSWEQPTGVVRKPLAAHQSIGARGAMPYSEPTQQRGPFQPYRPPTSRDLNHRGADDNSQSHNQPSRHISNASTRFSNGSDTSIEEEAAPAPLKLRSPFQGGAVRYPSVPVSAAESPTRHPNVAELPTRSDSLANRRLGKQKAQEIVDRLPDERQPPSRRKSAKYQILVSPGRHGIGPSGSPASTRFPVKTPPMDPRW